MSNRKSIFESVTFLNEDAAAVGIAFLISYGALFLYAAIKNRIDLNKERKSSTALDDKEFNKIMRDFKALCKDLDNTRSEFSRYKWVEDAQPRFKVNDQYFNIFKNEFNKGKRTQPYYSIIFEETDYDNLNYNVDRTFDFFRKITTKFAKSHGFKTIDDSQNGHYYLTCTDSDEYKDFEIKFHADTEYSISIEYNKGVCKKK